MNIIMNRRKHCRERSHFVYIYVYMAFCVSDVMNKAEVILHICLSCHKPGFSLFLFFVVYLSLVFSIMIGKERIKMV